MDKLKREDKIALLVLVALLMFIFLTGCRSQGLDPFPTNKIYEFSKGESICIEYTIISKDPLQVDEGVILEADKCPQSIFGFSYKDTPNVMNWIRRAQKEAQKKCQ